MTDLHELQAEVSAWSERNFGAQPAWKPLLGVGEEVGELNHAYLKQSQGIRMDEDHIANMQDAVGDIVIYLADFCHRMDINLGNCVEDAWNQVKHRDWRKPDQLEGQIAPSQDPTDDAFHWPNEELDRMPNGSCAWPVYGKPGWYIVRSNGVLLMRP